MTHVGWKRSMARPTTSSKAARYTCTGVPGRGPGSRVGGEAPAAGRAGGLQLVEVGRGMHTFEFGAGGRPWFGPKQLVTHARGLETGDDGVEAGRALGVAGPGVGGEVR